MNKKILFTLLTILLPLGLRGQEVHWQCDPHAFQYDMTACVSAELDNQEIEDLTGYEIAAFCGDECRGVAELTESSKKVAYLRIRSNQESGETISFKVYSKAKQKEYIIQDANSITFEKDALKGSPSEPWKLSNIYKIIYMVDGEVYKTSYFKYEQLITPEAEPTKEGHTFSRWSEIPETMPDNDLIVTGTFAYTITFNTDGGTAINAITQNYGTTITKPADPEKTGHTFKGWDKEIPATMPAEDVTITAQWDVNKYKVVWMLDGVEIRSEELSFGETLPEQTEPTREGYAFSGWQNVPADGKVPANDLTITGTLTIQSFTVTFDTDGGTAIDAITRNFGAAITPPADPTKPGYTFNGWDKEIPATIPAENVTIKALWKINSYWVTFVVEGTEVSKQKLEFNSPITKPADPTKEGYTFEGWTPEVPATVPASDVSYTAVFKIIQYTQTFKLGNGEEDVVIENVYGSELTAPTVKKEGYSFKGWEPAVPETIPAKNQEYTAQWQINQYTITFEFGNGEPNVVKTQDFATELTAPAIPTREGWDFAGWDSEVPATVPAGNVTYKAQWTKKTFKVTFDIDGVKDTKEFEFGTTIELPATPTKEGFTFDGWNPEVPATVPANDVTFTAKWKVHTHSVSFSADGKTVYTATVAYGETIPLPATDPEKEGSTFKAWKNVPETMPDADLIIEAEWTTNNYTVKFILDGVEIYNEKLDYGTDITAPTVAEVEGKTFSGWDNAVGKVTGEMTFTGSYITNAYTVTFKIDGEIYHTMSVEYNTAIQLPTPEKKTGYDFSGWTDVPEGGKMPAEDIIINGQWNIKSYTITFKLENGEADVVKTQNYNTAIDAPEAPTKEGYTFKGWLPAVDATVPDDDVTYTAQWQINTYELSFVLDGTPFRTVSFEYGQDISLPSDPSKEGYTFNGWQGVPADGKMPAKNVTITGTYTVNKYKVTFIADGETVKEDSVAFGAEIVKPTDPVKVGNTFGGWSPSISAGDKMPAHDVIYTALFSVNQYAVIFKDGETILYNQNLNYGDPITAPANPTREGYTFKGWSPDVAEIVPAAEQTYVAQWTANQYTQTFVLGNGQDNVVKIQDYATELTAPANPTREGYTFKGWDPAVPATVPAADTTYIAQWTINQYTQTFVLGNGQDNVVKVLDFAAALTAPENLQREGYTFKGWDPVVPATVPAADTTYIAQWTINTYKVFYKVDGADYKTVEVNFGATITPEDNPVQEGYTFSGWSEIPETMPAHDVTVTGTFTINTYKVFYKVDGADYKTVEVTFAETIQVETEPSQEGYTFSGWTGVPEDGKMPARDLTVTGSFTINQYTITFDTDGGSNMQPITQDYGTEVTPPTFNPIKTGYTFTGWDKEIPATMPAENVTIKATWTINQYTITFDTDGGSAIDAITQDYATAVTAPADPTKTGYTFTGWDKEIPATIPAENVTIKAQWTINQYTITFDTDGGSAIDAITQDYATAVTAPAAPTKTGYTFKGWDKEIPATMPAENVTIKATWTINQYTITFDTDGGSAIDAITQDYATAVTAPADPTKTGYTFTGWDKEIPATIPAENVTIKAQWTINQYTITFDTDGGSAIDAITQDYATAVTAPADPTKTGYTFKGWDKEIPATMPAENITIKALWDVNTYKLIYQVNGEDYKTFDVNYGEAITAEAVPVDEARPDRPFSGWSEIPATMPAEDVTITGRFTYYITYYDEEDNIYAADTLQFGETIIFPEYVPLNPERFTFLGWIIKFGEEVDTMPAYDLEFYAQLKDGIFDLLDTDGDTAIYSVNGTKIRNQATAKDIRTLPRGTYIIRGKKVFIR